MTDTASRFPQPEDDEVLLKRLKAQLDYYKRDPDCPAITFKRIEDEMDEVRQRMAKKLWNKVVLKK
jgi:hypothetical protein